MTLYGEQGRSIAPLPDMPDKAYAHPLYSE
jgi:hypothetical protein